jgi:hypothetical protein
VIAWTISQQAPNPIEAWGLLLLALKNPLIGEAHRGQYSMSDTVDPICVV